MTRYEKDTFTITEERNAVELVYCDVCKRLIYKKDLRPNAENKKTVHYWGLSTSHNDWGNDSVDSFEYFTLCSPDCAKVKFVEYIDGSNSPHNTMRFDIQHMNTRAISISLLREEGRED